VHPGDTTKNYIGLHWVSAAKAILAGDSNLRSTLFFADKSEDNGPVLVQSKPLNIIQALSELEAQGEKGLIEELHRITLFASLQNIKTYDVFREKAHDELQKAMGRVCSRLQDMLKVSGDWESILCRPRFDRCRKSGRRRPGGIHRRETNAGLGYRLDERL